MAINIGSLFASLTLQSSQFSQGTRQATRDANMMARGIQNSMGMAKAATIGFFGALSVGALVSVTKNALDYAASLGEVAQQTGVTTATLQEMRYVATQVGLSTEEMDKALSKFTVSIGKAADGSKGLQESFSQVGVSLQELSTLSPDQLLGEVAEGFGKITDPATRARLEVELFGKTGQKLDTALAGGREALDELREAAHRLGLVLSEDEIKNADRTADKIAELQTMLSMRVASIVAKNSDAIFNLASSLASLAGSMAQFWSQNPEKVMAILGALAGISIGRIAGPWGALIGGVGGAIAGYSMAGEGAVSAGDVKAQSQRVIAAQKAYKSEVASSRAPNRGVTGGRGGAGPASGSSVASKKKALDAELAKLNQMTAALEGQNALRNGGGLPSLDGMGRTVTPAGGGGGKGKGRSGTDPLEDDRKLIDDLKFQQEQLKRTAIEQEVFNNLQRVGADLTTTLGQSIADETRKLEQQKALKEWNDEMDRFNDNTREAIETMGMSEFDKMRYDLAKLHGEKPLSSMGAAEEGDITVRAKRLPDPKYTEGLKNIAELEDKAHRQLIDNLQFEMDQLGRTAREQAIYNALKQEGVTLESTYGQAIAGMVGKLYDAQEAYQKAAEAKRHFEMVAENFADIGINLFDSLIWGTENWKEAFSNAIMDLGRLMLEELVYRPLAEMMKNGFLKIFGGLAGSLFGGATAAVGGGAGVPSFGAGSFGATGAAGGGSAKAGQDYWVGERGPELFRPTTDGQIVPTSKLGGRGGVVVNVDARGSTNPAEVRRHASEAIIAAMPMIRQDAHAYTMRKFGRPVPL